ncbi:hypothetical protein SAMN02745866_03610 [Alteromonadaceae bacterium Bs31]|nr:hypothetical protein SAMN02745866_03610 [Alteromonadaceae bacterium Bs31]
MLHSSYRHALIHLAQTRLNLLAWWLLAIVTYIIARLLQTWLDAAYLASEFPVPFYIGQTTFSAPELKSYFQVLIDKGTLGLFIKTQLIDYVFMIGTFVSFFCLSTAVMRSVKAVKLHPWMLSIGVFFVWFSPLAAVFDALENLVSFVMLRKPLEFADWLVMPYSSFAVAKFSVFISTYLWCLVAMGTVLLVIAYRGTMLAVRKFQPGRAREK